MKINGNKIYLTEISDKYAKVYTKWIHDPDVLKYTTVKSMKLNEERKWIKTIKRSKYEKVYSIFIKESGEPIGNIGVHDLNNPRRNYFLGIIIGDKNHRGKGYGTDALKTMLHYLFTQLKANKVLLDVRTENEPAIHVYKKCGFKIIERYKEFIDSERGTGEYFTMEVDKKNARLYN